MYRKEYNGSGAAGELQDRGGGVRARTMAQIKIYGKQLSGKYRETDYILVAPLAARQKAMKTDMSLRRAVTCGKCGKCGKCGRTKNNKTDSTTFSKLNYHNLSHSQVWLWLRLRESSLKTA